MPDLFSECDRGPPPLQGFFELAALGQGPAEKAPRAYGWKGGEAKPFPSVLPRQQPDVLPEDTLGLPVVPFRKADLAQIYVGMHLKREVAVRLAGCTRAQRQGTRFALLAGVVRGIAQVRP